MFEGMVTLLNVAFVRECDYHARVRVASHQDAKLQVSILHESLLMSMQDIAGDAISNTILVMDKESLTIIARRNSLVVAAGIFEVDVSLIETIGAVLSPRCTSNLIVDQHEVQSFGRDMRMEVSQFVTRPWQRWKLVVYEHHCTPAIRRARPTFDALYGNAGILLCSPGYPHERKHPHLLTFGLLARHAS